ncbi:hypothetical protein [Hymenobacter metallilatus]|uniref:Uncharacterized protein n=1 Tax=Hymenobacter metallilatus TaxID=2493666 RepID=A0A428IYY4_9BACT|nr:hypothetical protein [Hymenobacter metallilatus]RSK24193.1 hypothetical protein EI290_20650 [Hymenobacter metallilatus]
MASIKINVETHVGPTFISELEGCYSFTVENHGTVPAEVAFNKQSPVYVPLPPGTARSFDCLGNTPYEGTIVGRFAQEGGTRRVNVTKSVLNCQQK